MLDAPANAATMDSRRATVALSSSYSERRTYRSSGAGGDWKGGGNGLATGIIDCPGTSFSLEYKIHDQSNYASTWVSEKTDLASTTDQRQDD